MLLLNNLTKKETVILAAAFSTAGLNMTPDNIRYSRATYLTVTDLLVFYKNKGLHPRKLRFLQKIVDKVQNLDIVEVAEDNNK